MTKWKTLFSTLVLTLVLLLNIAPNAHADTGKLTMTADRTNLNHGETVKVTVASNLAFETKGAGITVAYDAAVLEPVSADSEVKSGFKISGPLTVNGKTVLRISSFPGEGGHTVGVDEPLAVLAFHTKAPGDDIKVEMTAAYLYDTALNRIDLALAEPISIGAAVVPVKEIKLDRQAVEMEIKSTTQLKATVLPENASNQTVIWASSNPEVVSVDENGKLTALNITEENAPVTITASSGDITAECIVTVVYPPNVGYVVSVPKQKVNVVGELIEIPLTVNNTDAVDKFNAFDITLTYDPEIIQVMEVIGPESTELTVKDSNGSVQILGYGDSQTFTKDTGANAFNMKVKALKTGSSYISIVDNARVDHSANAVISNAAKAALYTPKDNQDPWDQKTHILIDKFNVKLPQGFGGDTVADPAKPYVFWDNDTNRDFYDYQFSGKIGSGDLVDEKVIRREDGSFSVDPVTGHLDIKVTKTGKKYDVVFGRDITGTSSNTEENDRSKAQFGYDYEVKLNWETGFQYVIKIYIGGKYYDSMSGERYTIPGEVIKGEITFDVTKNFVGSGSGTTSYSVTFQGSGAEDADYDSTSVAYGGNYSFRLNKAAGYIYSVSYKMGNGKEKRITPEEGRYAIENVTGNLVIIVEKQKQTDEGFRTEVRPYLTLDEGKTIYLILVKGQLDDTEFYAYGDSPMYYSEEYGAWCLLIPQNSSLSPSTVRQKITVQTGRMEILDQVLHDVNMTGHVDVNDAQLAYDMYNGKYPDFTKIDMQRFLNADVVPDKKITVADVAAVVSGIE